MNRTERSLPRSFPFRFRFSLSAILFLAGVLLLFPFLLSCEKNEPNAFEGGSFLLTPENMQGFTVVRSDSASDLVVKESLRIAGPSRTATGKKVDLVTDWQRKGSFQEEPNRGSDAPAEDGGLELLVGLTSRTESEALLPELTDGDYYILRTVGQKILIASTSEALLSDAVDKFLSDYVSIEKGEVRIARKIDYQSDNYTFFRLARGGESRSGFVLPKDAGEPLFTAVRAIAKQMEKDYGCSFQIYREETLNSLQGMILVGKHDSALCQNILSTLEDTEGIVKYAGGQLIITGKTDGGRDRRAEPNFTPCCAPRRIPTARVAPTSACRGTFPSCVIGSRPRSPIFSADTKEAENSIATTEVQVTFAGVSTDLLERYAETLKKSGYSILWRSVQDNRSFLAENGKYRLQVNHSESLDTASVYILRKSSE